MAKISVLIGADDREFQAALKRARKSLNGLSKEMRDSVNAGAKWAAGAAAAGVAVSAYLVKGAMDAVDAQAKLARRLDTTSASLAVLERAGEMSGVEMTNIAQSAGDLTRRLSQAALTGAGPAKSALDALGLSARELQSIPLDQRLIKINTSLEQNADSANRAALAGQLFGEEGALLMTQLNPEVIAQAAQEVEAFGLNLSAVDAAKVEQANDAMSRVGMMMDGFLQQVAVQAAPVIQGIADALSNAAKEAGGFGNMAASAFNTVITGAGFVMDAIEGIRRVFLVVADAIVTGAAAVAKGFAQNYAALLRLLDAVPGIDFSETIASVDAFAAEADGVINQAVANIQETLEKPMPSKGLEKFVEDAKAASQAAAEAAVAAQQNGGGEDATQSEDGLTDKERESMQKRLDAMRQQYMTEEELSQLHRDEELARIQEFEDAKLIAEGEGQMMRQDAEFAHWQRIREMQEKEAKAQIDLDKKKHDALRKGTADFMSNLSGLMNTENRKMFELGKAAAIGQAVYKGGLAVMDAWEAGMSVGGPWAPAVATAYAGAAALNAANLINNIRSQQFGGGGGTPTAPTQGSSNISPDNGAGGGSTAGSSSSSPTSIINLQGDFFSRDAVRGLLEQLNDESADGGRYVIA